MRQSENIQIQTELVTTGAVLLGSDAHSKRFVVHGNLPITGKFSSFDSPVRSRKCHHQLQSASSSAAANCWQIQLLCRKRKVVKIKFRDVIDSETYFLRVLIFRFLMLTIKLMNREYSCQWTSTTLICRVHFEIVNNKGKKWKIPTQSKVLLPSLFFLPLSCESL